MSIILHITHHKQWEAARAAGLYRGDTLASEGFIHCSTPAQVLRVANRCFHGQQGLVLLLIAVDRLEPELRYEPAEDGELFPHIYGPLNTGAVVQALDFPTDSAGAFTLPAGLAYHP